MKILSNSEWKAVEEYTLQLKKQKMVLEDRISELVINNNELLEETKLLKDNQLSTKTALLDQVHKTTKENLSLKATLESCLELLNSIEVDKERVGVKNLLDIVA